NAANTNSPPVDLLIDGATAAAFSPDQMKLFILTNTGKLFVSSSVDALAQVPLAGSATDLTFAADGSFAYIAGAPVRAVTGIATCNLQNMGTSTPALVSNPLQIFALPAVTEDHLNPNTPAERSVITQNLLALEPPNLQFLTAQFTHDVLTDPTQLTCNGSDQT